MAPGPGTHGRAEGQVGRAGGFEGHCVLADDRIQVPPGAGWGWSRMRALLFKVRGEP